MSLILAFIERCNAYEGFAADASETLISLISLKLIVFRSSTCSPTINEEAVTLRRRLAYFFLFGFK